MKVLYCSPNKSHHYGYAGELQQAGMLHAFVSGFPRLAKKARFPDPSANLIRADQVQALYLASLRAGLPRGITGELAHISKVWIDRSCRSSLPGADLFLFYNGCGLQTARRAKECGILTMVEAVNSHVLAQEAMIKEEHLRIGIPWRRFHRRETQRRILEYTEADRILVPSEFVRRSFMEHGIPSQKIVKVPYRSGSHTPSGNISPSCTDPDAPFRILFVGTISPRKGVRYLIEAFRQFEHPRKELWLVGPIASPSGLEGILIPSGVHFKGVLKGEALEHAYRNASLFCLPTLEEGLALVLAEALAHGLPVVTTRNSGAEDLFEHGECGVMTEIRDADAMRACFERCVEDPEWFRGLKRKATRRGSDLACLSSQKSLLVEALCTWEASAT
jgi:glycosyltransferase involved in cell wall biosynthesis